MVDRAMKFFPGIHQPGDASNFERSCISIHRLIARVKAVLCREVLIDSGAFTKLLKHGCYPESVWVYARQLHRLSTKGIVKIVAAVAQDYMCEPFMLAKTGLTIADHQRLTIERYDELLDALRTLFGGEPPFHLMPVLQGQSPDDYVRHLRAYGDRIKPGMWVGVGSVCKRQGSPSLIEDLLLTIKEVRPDLRLHGFRREADRPQKPRSSCSSLVRRQHGVELLSSKARSERKRLARSARVHRPHRGGRGSRMAAQSMVWSVAA